MDKLTRAQITELSDAIRARGFTLEGLSMASGLDPSAIVQVMQGQLRPSLWVRQRLAAALGIDPEALQ